MTANDEASNYKGQGIKNRLLNKTRGAMIGIILYHPSNLELGTGHLIYLESIPVTNDRENHQASMLPRFKAQNTWMASLALRLTVPPGMAGWVG